MHSREIRVFTNDVGLGCDSGHAVAFPHGTKHQVGQSANQEWRIVQSGHHKKLTDPRRLCLFPCLDVDLVQGFNVLGQKLNWNHEDALDSAARKLLDGIRE